MVKKRKKVSKTEQKIGASKICPKCGKVISDYPALSRKDNRTEICSNCGTLEALEDFRKYGGKNGKSKNSSS